MNTHYLSGLPQEWTAIAEVFSALGDGTRQTILLLFEPGESIELKTFVDILPLSRSAVVHHLKVLEQAGLLIAAVRASNFLFIFLPYFREDQSDALHQDAPFICR